jgi:hypothetical protein
MADRERLTYFPDPVFTLHQSSSYNRESVSPDSSGWFANGDASRFIRVETNGGRREFVLLDTEGPGAVVRWWMTFWKAQHGTLRVYIDNDTIPVLSGLPADILRGKSVTEPPLAVAVQDGAPLGEEGRDYDHNFYVPLPFSSHCKITYECDFIERRYEADGIKIPEGFWWPDAFYNIGYRLYPKNVKVESVTAEALASARELLNKTGKSLTFHEKTFNEVLKFGKTLGSGDSLVVGINESGLALKHLALSISAADLPQALRSVVLKGSFDNTMTIWTPSGEFFGSGYCTAPHETWMTKADTAKSLESWWIMPFRESCSLVFINYGRDSVTLSGSAGFSSYEWKESSMYFASSWHEYYNIRTVSETQEPFDLNYVKVRGKGIYAGDQITLFNSTHDWWGEGDEKIFIDGEKFPSSFGTGSEDYYGYSFGREESFSHPFLSQPSGKGNMSPGLTVNTRLRSLDAIPFYTGISSNIELWHWADTRINYALTTFFYVLPGFSVNIYPDAESVKHPVVFSKNDFTLGDK